MATKTETIYHHTCDLCGAEKDEKDLRQLWGREARQPGISRRPKADICTDCQGRPVSDVIEFLANQGSQEEQAEFVSLRVKRAAGERL